MRRILIGLALISLGLGACRSGRAGSSLSGSPSPSASSSPRAAPTGLIAFDRPIPGTEDSNVFTIDVDGSNDRQLAANAWDPFLSVDGGSIRFFRNVKGGAVVTIERVDGSGPSSATVPGPGVTLGLGVWSADGSRVAAEGFNDAHASRDGIYLFRSVDGGGVVRVTHNHDIPIAFSPDGSKILFLRTVIDIDEASCDSGEANLFVVNVDGTDLTQLNPPGTSTGLTDTPVVGSQGWSPDGKQVIFVAGEGSFCTGEKAAYVVNVDGTNAHQITPVGNMFDAVWSPDGRWIAYDMPHGDSRDLFLVHPDGTEQRLVTNADDGRWSFGPAWSPDSRWLVFDRGTRDDFSDSDLWIVRVDGTGLTRLTERPGKYTAYVWGPRP